MIAVDPVDSLSLSSRLATASRLFLPRSGLSRSDLVRWPDSDDFGGAKSRQLTGVLRPYRSLTRIALPDPSRKPIVHRSSRDKLGLLRGEEQSSSLPPGLRCFIVGGRLAQRL